MCYSVENCDVEGAKNVVVKCVQYRLLEPRLGGLECVDAELVLSVKLSGHAPRDVARLRSDLPGTENVPGIPLAPSLSGLSARPENA